MSSTVRAATSARATTAEEWVVRLAAAIPVVLATFGFQQPVGPAATGLLLLPAVVVTATLTAAAGQWAGLVGVLAAAVVGQLVPSDTTPTVLAVLAALVAATAWAAEVLVSTSRPALAVVPPVLLLLVALVVGLAGSGGSLLLVVGVAVAIVFLLFLVGSWTGAGDGPDAAIAPTGRAIAWSVAAMAVVAMAAFAAGALADLLLDRAPRIIDISAPRPPTPPTLSDVRDPLSEATRWQMLPSEAGRELLTLSEPTQGARPVWLSMAVFNGAGWQVPGFYRTIDGAVPGDPAVSPVSATTRRVLLTVGAGLPGPWVPAPQRVSQVLGPGSLSVSVFSGAVASSTTPIGRSYEVLYRLPQVTPAQLEAAKPSVTSGDGAVQLPGALPPAMANLAADVAKQAGPSTWKRLVTLSRTLRAKEFRAAPASQLPLQGVSRTLEDYDIALADREAFQEQYAAIFALVARSWGVPTRLCLGFLPAAGTGTAETLVTGPDTSVWAEARLEGIGWVAFQPSPQDREAGRPAVVRPPTPSASPTPAPTPAPTSTAATPRPTPSKETEPEEQSTSAQAVSRAIPIALLLLLPEVVWLLFVWLRRRLARAGLARGPERRRVVGAWAWARRCLREAGLPLPPGASPDRVADPADAVAEDLPPQVAEPLRALAAMVAPALYSPDHEPPPAADRSSGDLAWALVGEVEHACLRSMSWRQRARRWLVPGSSPAVAEVEGAGAEGGGPDRPRAAPTAGAGLGG